MTQMMIVLVIIAYILGNISPATILAKMNGLDIKKEGSGNAGTTNVLRVLGWKAALVTLAIDILKGVIAVKIGMNYSMLAAELCMLAVILGHCFPAAFRFKGGKGVATAFGALLALNWPSAFAALAIALIGTAISKKMSVGSIAAAISYPFLVLIYFTKTEIRQFMPIAVILAVLILFNHRANIARLARGEESQLKVGSAKEKAKEATEEIRIALANALPMEEAIDKEKLDKEVSEAIDTEHKALTYSENPVDYYKDEKHPKLTGEQKKKVAVIGSGSFGSSLANLLANKGHSVTLYGRSKEAIEEIRDNKANKKYLPGVLLTGKLRYTSNIRTAAKNRDVLLFAVPAQKFRPVLKDFAKYIPKETIIVNVAKGIEEETLMTMSEVAKELLPDNKYAVVSGPTHAEEIARNYPASVVAASSDIETAELVQDLFMTNKFRVYTSEDVKGVELGGALKNVIAIGTGIADGMELGDNTRAALMTRGIHEITRLGAKLGADEATFSGLSGIGDLMVTCASDLSRNRRCGILIGQGKTAEEAVSEIGTVEGFHTVDAAKKLAEETGVEMPITNAVSAIINGDITLEMLLPMLMERDRKGENSIK